MYTVKCEVLFYDAFSIYGKRQLVNTPFLCYNYPAFYMHITSPRLYFRDYYILLPLLVSVGLHGFVWWYTLSKIATAGEQLYLHYNIIFGIDQYGPRSELYYPLFVGLAVLVVNSIGSFCVYRFDRTIARIIMVLTASISIFLLAAMVFIVGLNL